jgi:hypothetical protein
LLPGRGTSGITESPFESPRLWVSERAITDPGPNLADYEINPERPWISDLKWNEMEDT